MDVTTRATPTPSPSSSAAELVIDQRDTIESLNAAAEALFGYPAAELRGRRIDTLILPRPDRAPGTGTAPATLTDPNHLILGRHRSGTVVPLFATRQPGDDGAHIRLERPAASRPGTGAARPDQPGMTRHHLLILNALLRPAAGDIPLRTRLEFALDLILSLPGLPAEKRGSIVLLDTDGQLTLRVAREPATAGDYHDCEIPIADGERLLGILVLGVPRHTDALGVETDFLWLIAETLAALIERLRAEEENRQLLDENRRLNRRLVNILEEERRRLARELHDDVGQSLTAIKADAALIVNRCGAADSPVHRSATAISATADHLYDVTHALIRQLRPGALDDLGIVAAVQSYVQAWRERRPGMACTFRAEGNLNGLGEEVNITVYRVVQESLTNVIRHAAASRVEIRLTRVPNAGGADEVCVQVRDDGRGVEPQQLHAKQRFGLLGIRERVEGLGGRLTLDSRPGQGFRLSACLPVPAGDT